MRKDFIKANITSQANYVEYGYGQVEPNHLSAQRTAQIYAQLPAASTINVLEQGQFVKYDYAAGVADFVGAGEWMLVYNEIKLYHDNQIDCEFALVKDDYQARVYSPYGYEDAEGQTRYYNGKDSTGATSITINGVTYAYDDVTKDSDIYEIDYNNDPFHIPGKYHEAMMPTGTAMVPRVFKTNVGDIFTTNTIKIADGATPAVGDTMTPGATGILEKTTETTGMLWQIVKIYTLADGQKAVKLMRIQ